MFTKWVKHLKNLQLILFILRGRESHSISELRSWWQTSGASWRPEERETSSTSIGSPCLLTTGFPRLSSTLEYCGTLMRWCRRWRMVREQTRGCLSCQAQNAFSKKKRNISHLHVGCLAGELLASGDREEVEIRGCSIWSVELIKKRFCKLVQERDTQTCSINSAIIDFYLWPYAKQHHKEMAHIPIHHTRCVYYWQTGGHVMYKCGSGTNTEKSRASGANGCPVAVEGVVIPESW